jgi:SpoVK/Ycf46/Vps4 family AAA+-type ATPase
MIMMYTEILRIIEGGLAKDAKNVYNYSKLLAEKVRKDGDNKMANMIFKAIENRIATTVTMDELLTTPVDQESRLSIVDVAVPMKEDIPIVLPKLVDDKITDFINVVKHQSQLIQKGVEMPNSLLLYGYPGCGKTTVAKYISEQTGLPLVIARFDAIVSSLLGNTAKNIRKSFDFADNKPCILFLDEFDAIAKARDDQYELGELKRVINSLLQNIDSFAKQNVLIAATNHPELLDKAIWRRFNTVIEIGLPQEDEIVKLLKTFINGFNTEFSDDDKRFDRLSRLLIDKSPSDIKTIINNAKAQTVISHKEILQYEDVLVELFEFNHRGNLTIEKLVEFLNDNGAPQASIAERMGISIRQVRNYLNKQS